MNFGERLKAERLQHKMTTATLAKSCGVSRSYITLIENGRRLPGTKVMPKLASALGIKPHELLNWYLEDLRGRLETSWHADK